MGRGRVKLTEVNPHLVCVLCRGYLIDATTITECLHSFCRSCIILYLERKCYCPICEVQIHKTKPYLNLKLDKTLQDIVYKLVPGLFHNEMRRRQEFYKSHPLHDRHLHPESRGIAIDRLIYSPDDSISLSLEYYDKEREREEWTSVGDTSTVATHGAEDKRYLLCPAVVTMAHLKKFLRSKYNLSDKANVEVIYRRESLPDTYSLMDVAYIYTWKQNEPMRFYYRIHVLTSLIKNQLLLESCSQKEKGKADNLKIDGIEDSSIKLTNLVSDESELDSSKNLQDLCKKNHVREDVKVPNRKEIASVKEDSVDVSQKNSVSHPESALLTDKDRIYQSSNKNSILQQTLLRSESPQKNVDSVKESKSKESNLPNKNDSTLDVRNSVSLAVKNTSSQSELPAIKSEKILTNGTISDKNFKVCPSSSNLNGIANNARRNGAILENEMPSSGNKSSNSVNNAADSSLNQESSRSDNNGRNILLSISSAIASTSRPPLKGPLSVKPVTSTQGNKFFRERTKPQPQRILPKLDSKVAGSDAPIKFPATASQLNSKLTEFNNVVQKNGNVAHKKNGSVHKNIDQIKNVSVNGRSNLHVQDVNNKLTNKVNTENSKSSTGLNTSAEIMSKSKEFTHNSTENKVLTSVHKKEETESSCDNLNSRLGKENNKDTTIKLDESAAALLSAIGLQPKIKTAVCNQNENVKEGFSDQSLENRNKEEDHDCTKSESSPGISDSNSFRSEHDEMSVSLLLGLSTVQNQTRDSSDTIKNKESTSHQSQDSKTVDPIESSAGSSPIVNIQNVVNNIVPAALKFNSSSATKEKSNTPKIKVPSPADKATQPSQVNGFKVPRSPGSSDKNSFNGSRSCHSPRPVVKLSSDNLHKSHEDLSLIPTAVTLHPQKKLLQQPYQSLRIPSPRPYSAAENASKSTKTTPASRNGNFPNRDNSKVQFTCNSRTVNNNTVKSESDKVKKNGDLSNSQVTLNKHMKTESKTEQTSEMTNTATETAKEKPSFTGSGLKSPVRESSTEVDRMNESVLSPNSKVNLLKRKLNSQPDECDVVVSAATRDDSLSEAKKRRQVTPDVSIELLSGPLSERGSSVKRPLFEYPSLTKKRCTDKSNETLVEGNHSEIRVSKIDQLCASAVKIEKVPSSQINNTKPLLTDKQNSVSDAKERLLSSAGKDPSNEIKLSDEDSGQPDITIEKMKESPKFLTKIHPETDCEVKVTKVADVSSSNMFNKRQTDSPSSSSTSSVSDAECSTSAKKIPRLIEINAPPRPKLDPTFQERKNQRTGLKMTTVRKEVPFLVRKDQLGKEGPHVKKDSNGALDLSGRGNMKLSPTSRPPSHVSPPEMFPSTALHQFFRQQLELQGRLLASHANNNLGRDWRKDPITAKHLEDWVRNAVSCGALPPHPLMFNPASAPTSPHRK